MRSFHAGHFSGVSGNNVDFGIVTRVQETIAVPIPIACTLTKFRIWTPSPLASSTQVITIKKNGSATSMTITLDSTHTDYSTAANPISFSPGDTIILNSNGSAGTSPSFYFVFEFLAAAKVSFNCMGTHSIPAQNNLIGFNSTAMTDTVQGNRNTASPIPTNGTLKNLYINAATAPTGTVTFIVVKNGVDTAITCTFSSSQTQSSDLTHSISVVPGDIISVKCSSVGHSGLDYGISMEFLADVDNESCQYFNFGIASASSTTFFGPSASSTAATTEDAATLVKFPKCKVKKFYAATGSALGGGGTGKAYNTTFRQNSANTSLVAQLIESTIVAGDTTHIVNIINGDLVSSQAAPANTPNANAIGFGMVVTMSDSAKMFLVS